MVNWRFTEDPGKIMRKTCGGKLAQSDPNFVPSVFDRQPLKKYIYNHLVYGDLITSVPLFS